jgi:hypothetical protein
MKDHLAEDKLQLANLDQVTETGNLEAQHNEYQSPIM